MPITPRLAVCFVLTFCLATAVVAEQHATITAAASADGLRFTAPGPTAQIRVQVFSPSGDAIFDSAWGDGNVLNWSSGALADGTYRCVVMVRDLEGNVTQKESALTAQDGKVSIEDRAGVEPKVTLLAHDGANGSIVSTAGDLSFRFGDFLAGKDVERMRLTANGDLQVHGVIRASNGIVMPDGTILMTAATQRGGVIAGPLTPNTLPTGTSVVRKPQPAASPDYQFKVDAAGVHIGTTNAFGLDVAGNVTLSSNLLLPSTALDGSAGVITLGGFRFLHSHGGTSSVFLGFNAGNFTMTGVTNIGLGGNVLLSNTTGNFNTGISYNTLLNNSTGSSNTAMGWSALLNNSSGSYNVAIGDHALSNNVIGPNNTTVGYQALYNSNGSDNTTNGYRSAYTNTTGSSNTVSGSSALYSNTTGSFNIAIGASSGYNLTTGNYNIDVGNAGVASESNTIRIGDAIHTRTFVAGINGVTTAGSATAVFIDSNGQLGTVSSSRRYKFDIDDMDSITDGLLQLRPVTFRYIAHGPNAARQYGLIAEEVADVYPELVTRDKDGQPDAVMYQFLAPMLLNEVQRQHRKIDEQQSTIDALTRRIEALESQRMRN